jgi:2-methylcitrate dehydratase PrpD
MPSLSEQIAKYLIDLDYDRLPAGIVTDIKSLILDYLGVAATGSGTISGQLAIAHVLACGSRPDATIIGSGTKAAPMLAAFANAISAHSIELDDVDDIALYHFSPAIVSAALAVAESQRASGRDLLLAVYAGCEIMARLSMAMNPSLRDRGFHTTPVCGVFAAAAAAGLLLRLSVSEMVNALGLAGAQASGLMEFYGESLQKRFNTGPPARNGICAAEMAKLGFTGSRDILEGKRGLFRAFSDSYDPDAFLHGLGEDFPVHIDFKPYSSARPIHNGVDCALQILKESRLSPQKIEQITIFRHPDWAHFHVIYNPNNMNEAQVSLPYSVAVAFATGEAFLEQYQEPYLSDPEVGRIMNLVKIEADSNLPRGVSCLMIVQAEGRSYRAQVDYPKGSKQNPFTQAEFAAKFNKLGIRLLDGDTLTEVAEQVFSLEKITDIRNIIGPFQTGGAA